MSILRLLLLILVLLNLLALAASTGLLGERERRGEPERLTNQLHPERIQLRSGADAGDPGTPRPSAPPAPSAPDTPPAPAPETPAAPAPQPVAAEAPAVPAPVPQACMMFSGLGGDLADAVVRLFDAPNFSVRREASEAVAGWWVRIPPDGTREYAERKARELRGMGVTDFFIVQEPGPNQYAVSLGIFKTEAAANQHLEQLRAQRVRSASVGTRSTTVYRVEIRGPQPQLDALRRSGNLPGAALASDCAP
ncbi:SPOR domain-containing protein [Pseudothauera nasutitermitis]|uniref:SPOR domain-containing protein n=1 Tax=Pseudothauera nasutitermitis TaxID=2565930 RepID=A0A4S4AV72_9RHOO|nr:SPOR domain-containing protein [Pseudothauera nasutitermitis]THF63828.1 SPOR domain-containing protein [Pseudothauera nasutitermitis]